MARRIVDEEMRFNVVINGDKAQKELFDLEKANRTLISANKDLKKERAELFRQGKRGSAEYKALSAEIQKNSKTVEVNKARMSQLQKEIGVTGLTMAQLKKRAAQLRIQLNNMVPGSASFNKFQAELDQVNVRLRTLRTNGRQAQSSLSRLANGFNKYAVLAGTFIAALTGIVFKGQQLIDFNGKLSDAQADVQKTTGLSKKGVDELTKSFGLFQTRTDRINLLKIAEEGGRIGILKEDIGEFVEVMNKAVVALGDSFPGGASETAKKLGILKNLFKETKDQGVDEAYNAIGSAINELGASGAASEVNIANFATRVGSLPDALKPTVSEALALGAAFEESGITAEISGRAYGIFVKKASEETAKFGKVMGLTTQEVENLINDDPLEFMLKFSKGMKGMNATETAQTLDYLGVSADGANKVIGAMANNTDLFREKLELSSKAMEEGTSLMNEFNIKNNNLAALLDKIRERFNDIFTNETLVKWLEGAVNWFAKLIGATEDSTGRFAAFRAQLLFLVKVLAIVIASIITYNGALRLQALFLNNAYRSTRLYIAVQKALTLAQSAGRTAVLLLKAAFFALTGQTQKARAAMILLNRVSNLNPWVLLATAVVAVGTALVLFSKEAEEAKTAQALLNDAIADAQIKTAGAIGKIKTLQSVVEDETASELARKNAIAELNRIVPEYNKNTDLSKSALDKGKLAIDHYVESLQKQAEAQFLADQIAIKSKLLREQENASLEEHISWYEQLWNGVKSLGNAQNFVNNNFQTALKNRREAIALTRQELEATKEAYKEYVKLNPNTVISQEEFSNTFNVVNTNSGTSSSIDQQQKFQDALLALRRKNSDLEIDLIKNGFQKEMIIEQENNARRMEDLRAQLVTEGTLTEEQMEKNGLIRKQMELEEEKHRNKLGSIITDQMLEDATASDTHFKDAQERREAAHKRALQALGDNEQAKKALQKTFNEETLVQQQAHLQEMLDALNAAMSAEDFQGFDLELLTEEQKDQVLDRLEELGVSLEDLAVIRSKINNPGDEGIQGPSLAQATSGVDILGFTGDQWKEMFSNLDTLGGKFELAVAAVGVLMNAYAQYSEFLSANEQKDLNEFEQKQDQEREALERRLNRGLISQESYDKQVAAMDADLEAKKEALAEKQAKREKAMILASIAMNTAQAIMGIWAQFPKVDFGATAAIMTGVVAALGAVQAATVLATPIGFEQGFYGDTTRVRRAQDGKEFDAVNGGPVRSGLVDRPTTFLAGEGGKNFPELIIDGPALKRFDPNLKQSLYNEIARVKGFEGGYYGGENGSFRESGMNKEMTMALDRNTTAVMQLMNYRPEAILVRTTDTAKKINEDIEKYKSLREKSKVNGRNN